jgi:hypothetical protein
VRYPPATWKGDGHSGGSYVAGPYRVVLHTTETQGLPSYSGGATAPHLTYDPRSRRWTQHTDLNIAARALRNLSGGVQTNRQRALQVEIICYSNKALADQLGRLWVGNLPATAYDDLQAFIRWSSQQYGVVDKWPGRQAFSYGGANVPGFRMTAAQWIGYTGVCGHQHVPENTHWDPGALQWGRLIGGTMPPPQDGQWYWDEDEPRPIVGPKDARLVNEYQGWSFWSQADFDYDENDPAQLDERHKVISARMIDWMMRHP